MWTYATCGMSQPGDEIPIELHMFSPWATDELTELLYVVTYYHRTGRQIGLGHTVNFGKPWLGTSSCDHRYVSLPYLDGPNLEVLCKNPNLICCYWLIPVTAGEVEFRMSEGVDALEERFKLQEIDYLDLNRPSVA